MDVSNFFGDGLAVSYGSAFGDGLGAEVDEFGVPSRVCQSRISSRIVVGDQNVLWS